MDVNDLRAKVFYYCRERHYHSMQEAALDGLKTFPGNAGFQLYHGLSLVLAAKPAEGLRELESVERHPDVQLGAIVAMQWTLAAAAAPDKPALAALDARLKTERKSAGETALYHAAVVHLHLGRPHKAAEYADRLLKSHPASVGGLTVKAWSSLAGRRPADALKHADAALRSDPRDLDAALAKLRALRTADDATAGAALVAQLAARHPGFAAPRVEAMRLRLAARDWDGALEAAGRALDADAVCLPALGARALAAVCRDGGGEAAAPGLRRLAAETERREPGNAGLLLDAARVFSRAAGGDEAVLTETHRMAERALAMGPGDAAAACELGRQALMRGKRKDALRLFRAAAKADEASVDALVGLTWCQAEEAGFGGQARQQIEFLKEVQGSSPSASVLLMLAHLEQPGSENALALLDSAAEVQLAGLAELPFGPEYLVALDPDLMLKVLAEYGRHGAADRGLALASTLSSAVPGSAPALLALAAAQFRRNELSAAEASLRRLLDKVDAASAEGHLLMAQVNVRRGDFQRAEQCLERGVSFNFSVRERPQFHLISALISKQQSDFPRCIVSLQAAIAGSDSTSQEHGLSLSERCGAHLELAAAYRSAGQPHEAAEAMAAAARQFGGTAEQGRLAIANADVALERGDTQAAIALLDAVKPGQPYFTQACCKMAEVHLTHRKDKRAFSECYRDMVAASPDAATFTMLGDAYISVQEPEMAIEAYEQALAHDPRNSELQCKKGKALVRGHQYKRAVAFYASAAAEADCSSALHVELSRLQLRLGDAAAAAATAAARLRDAADADEQRTELLRALAAARAAGGDGDGAMAALRSARDNQMRVAQRLPGPEQRRIVADVCLAMADRAEAQRDLAAAAAHYQEALSFSPGDRGMLVALAKLQMQANELGQCEASCALLLNEDPRHEPALVMMADIAFRRTDFDTATRHFQALLTSRPDYWTALARLVEVLRRTGRLPESAAFLSRAEAAPRRPGAAAGLAYCRGLAAWYGGQRNAALRLFNAARRDAEWGQQAVYNMVKICLSSEDELLGFAATDDDEGPGGAREMTLRTADQLMRELKPGVRDQALSRRLLGNFLLLAAGGKANADRVMADLTSLASQEAYQDHAGVAYAMAVTYLSTKQAARARNQLKRVAKSAWSFEDADYLEASWVLLADLYVGAGKLELAGELARKLLQHNRGSAKAFELSAAIAEKEQGHREAALLYEQAWKLGSCANPGIGFKLAFNHLKSKRFADAIDVSQKVLRDFPEYPRIRKDILDKAMSNLRT